MVIEQDSIADFGLRIADCLCQGFWEKEIRNPQSEIKTRDSAKRHRSRIRHSLVPETQVAHCPDGLGLCRCIAEPGAILMVVGLNVM